MSKRILPHVKFEEIPPQRFHEYLEIFNVADLGNVSPPKSVEQMLDWQRNANYKFFIVKNQSGISGIPKGEVVGACAINFWEGQAFFSNQFVIPKFRGNGFGGAFRVELEKIARERNAKSAGANIHWRDLRQIRRLWKAGYKPLLSIPLRFEGKTYLRFRKRL